MLQPGRNVSTANYRYGFNGKENDNDVKGVGNQVDYGFRIYDPRIGRFLSLDPLQKEYPMLTPYQYASNTPIWAIDIDGLEGTSATNAYGEKQIYKKEIPAGANSFGIPVTTTVTETPANAKPVTQNLNDKQIYKLATLRILSPGQFRIRNDQYLDESYFSAENNIKKFLSLPITNNTPNTEYWRRKTVELQGLVLQGIFSDDDNTASLSIQQIKNRLSSRTWLTSTENLETYATLGVSSFAGWAKALNSSLTKTLGNLGIPKGFGIFADPSKWRVLAVNLTEQIAMKEAMSGQGRAIMGVGTNQALDDARLAGMNVTKYQFTHIGSDVLGNKVKTTIHYLKNNETGVLFDFKFTTK